MTIGLFITLEIEGQTQCILGYSVTFHTFSPILAIGVVCYSEHNHSYNLVETAIHLVKAK